MRLSIHRPGRVAALLAFIVLALCASRHHAGESAQGVYLVAEGNTFTPGTTLELRFDEPVVDDARVGTVAPESPLKIQPPLAGEWTWLSRRSGVFRLREAPALAREYRLTLRPGFGARFSTTLRTPDFDLLPEPAPGYAEGVSSSTPQLAAFFNADVAAAAAAKFSEFRDAAGQRAAAQTRQLLVADLDGELGRISERRTWQTEFQRARGGAPAAAAQPKGADPQMPIPNGLWVWPAAPLPPGTNWQLVFRAGLPAAERGLRLRKPASLTVGTVLPFAATSFEARNGLNSGRRIWVGFSRPISPELNTSNVLRWIQVEPAPPRLSASVEGDEVGLAGDFELHTPYRVTVKRGFPSREPATQGADVATNLVFEPIPPRLYFATFDAEQMSAGRRELPLFTVNVHDVRLRAKRLDRQTLVHALRAYRSYPAREAYDRGSHEPYREIDFNVLAGRTVIDTNFSLAAATDVGLRTTLAWDSLLAGRRNAALFVAAERGGEDRPRLGTQTLVQLTDIGLFWKSSPGRLWVMAFSYTTAKPLAGARLTLVSDENEPLAEQVTDDEGRAQFEWPAGAAWLVAETDDDLRAANLSGNAHGLYVNARVPMADEWSPTPANRRLLFFADRPVYRPGETVELKAILRNLDEQGLHLPAGATARLRLFDARERPFLTTNVAFSALGSWNGAVALPQQVLGRYRAELEFATNDIARFWNFFTVADYRPAAFQITMRAPAVIAAGERVEVPVTARYLFGEEVGRGRLRWSLEAADAGFSPAGFDDFRFCAQVYTPSLGFAQGSGTAQGEAEYVRGSPLTIAPALPLNPQAPQPRAADLLVELTDQNQQTISQAASFVRHSSDFYLGVFQPWTLGNAGDEIPLRVVAVDASGEPHATPVDAHLRIQRIHWRVVRLQGAGGSVTYRSEPELETVADHDLRTCEVQRVDGGWTVPAGAPSATTLRWPAAGDYLLEVTAKDSAGRSVVTALRAYVAGPTRTAWDYRSPGQLELVPDRERYRVGETATVLVKSPFRGTAIVSLERDHVRSSFVTNLTGNAPALRLPLDAGCVPNVFASVMLLRGLADSPRQIREPEYALGYCRLEVEQPETRLAVELRLAAADVRPGQPVKVEAGLRDGTGQPVPDAEVTLYAVDDGVLALTDFHAPDPFAVFYATQPLAVRSACTLPALVPEDPEALVFGNKGYLGGGGGRSRDALRKNFRATAYWNATLRTDAQGRLHAEFPAPDNLTRYRVIAVAQTARNQFGAGETSFQVNKVLMLEPAVPPIARIGDELRLRALLHNRTGRAGEVEVRLELDDHAESLSNPTGALTRRVQLPAQGALPVDFPVRCTSAGSARWVWRAAMVGSPAEASDAVESTLVIEDPAPLLREVLVAGGRGSASNLLAAASPQALEGAGTITVRVANTRLGDLGEAIAQLLHYPYGCAEQTASSVLPWLVLRDFTNSAPALARAPAEVQRAVERGVNRLLFMQAGDGGLAYWPGGRDASFWISGYGGLALALAGRQGVPLPGYRVDSLHEYLRRQLRNSASPDASGDRLERCLALWTLAVAGHPEPGLHAVLFERRARLSAEARALLALAILESGGEASLARELLTSPAPAPADEDPFGCAPRETAVRLLAWCRLDPESPEVDRLVEELLRAQSGAAWVTTQGNAWAVLALAEYARRVEAPLEPAAGSIGFGNERHEFALPATPATFETTFAFAPPAAAPALRLENPTGRRLFTQTTVATRSRLRTPPAQNRGFALERAYAVLNDDGSLRPFAGVRVGDRVLVTLRITTSRRARFVALEDPLPALFEAVNPEFKTQQTRAGANLEQNWVSDFHELRDDRALFFCDGLPPGTHTLRYLARVRAAGVAVAPGARAEEMYHPERLGLTEAVRIEASPAE